jgi:hypothetical protein
MLRSWSPVKNWCAVRAWSRHPPAACRRHPARGVRGEEGNGAGNVVRLGHALQRLHAEGEIPARLAWIEGGLLRETLHEVVDAADPRRVLLPVVDLVERELILDRRLLLDKSLAEFRLLPAARCSSDSRRPCPRHRSQPAPMVEVAAGANSNRQASPLWPCWDRWRHDPLLKPSILVVARLLCPDRMDARRHDDLVGGRELHDLPSAAGGRSPSARPWDARARATAGCRRSSSSPSSRSRPPAHR